MDGTNAEGAVREWRVARPVDLGRTLGVLRRGPADPAFRATPDGAVWRVSRTPLGPATLRVTVVAARAVVRAEAWGPGAAWLLDAVPGMVGAADESDAAAFVPHHDAVADALRRHPGIRLCRTGLLLEALVPAVLEQKVTAEEAYRGWRLLLGRFGERAPGPAPDARMRVPLAARDWALVPSWEWHRAGVDAKRAGTIVRAARLGTRLETLTALPPATASARLRTLVGIGPWTAAETLQRSHGAADEVSVGDLHLPRIVGRTLAAERDADDARMLDLLGPYGGQRYRACRYVLLSAPHEARRTPRKQVRDFRAM